MNRSTRRRPSGLASFTAVTVLIASLLVSSPAIAAVSTLDDALRASDVVVVAHPVTGSADTAAPLRLVVETVLLGAVAVDDVLVLPHADAVPDRGVWFLALVSDGSLVSVAEPRHPGWSDEVAAALPASGLRLRLNRHWFGRGEPVIVHLELHNRGDAAADYPGLWCEGDHLRAGYDLPLDVHRFESDAASPVDVRPVVARRLDSQAPVRIAPGERAVLTLQLEDYADLERPGLYRLRLPTRPGWGAAEVRLFIHP